jgi:hypothetical protein
MRLFAHRANTRRATKLNASQFSWACFALSPLCAAAQVVAPTNVDLADPANQQVLRSWQQQTGQGIPFGIALIDPATGKPVANAAATEFHGQLELGGYTNRVSVPSGNAALGSTRSGGFGKIVFQGDVRSTSAEQDITYAQGTFTSTDDRGVQPRYASQINNLQVGRSGPGYQIALGDVAANFSGLSTNQGLRGALLAKDIGALTATAYAGVVADSWEALSSRDTRDGQPARTRNLRDVAGLKADYKITQQGADQLSAYATLQHYRDQSGTASTLPPTVPLPLGTVIAPLTTLQGTIASLGGKYMQGNLQLSAELASSRSEDQNATTTSTNDSASDNAFVIDALYKLGSVSLRAGHHDLGANFASLAQTNARGVRETYAGAEWQISPQLLWGIDARTANTRAPTLGALTGLTGTVPASESTLDSLSNRVSYSLQDTPGLAFSLSDTRSQGRDALGNDNRIDTTQLGVSFANPAWSANLSLGIGHARSAANSAFDSNSHNWQIFVGRNWASAPNASAGNSASSDSWTLGLQGTLGQQTQKLLSQGTRSQGSNIGLNLQAVHTQLGTFSAGWQLQTTTQPLLGAPHLTSRSVQLDWSRDFGAHWNAKAYARDSRRNQGDALLEYNERTVGVQGTYKW